MCLRISTYQRHSQNVGDLNKTGPELTWENDFKIQGLAFLFYAPCKRGSFRQPSACGLSFRGETSSHRPDRRGRRLQLRAFQHGFAVENRYAGKIDALELTISRQRP
jgi:hypothetical protein